MADTKIGLSTFLSTALLAIIIMVGLGELYTYSIGRFQVKPWLGVVAAHAMLSLVLIIVRKPTREALRLAGTPKIAWFPGPMVLIGSYLLAIYTPSSGISYSPAGFSEVSYTVATVIVIPIVEEIVFRLGVTPFISRFVGGWWALWFSAIIFSVAHTHPSWERVIGLKIGLPLGPFLLAICCDLIVKRWGRVWPAVLFHSACNGTVYIFAKYNPSWLNHLGNLYM